MFVFFGWEKEQKSVDLTLKCYCYRCQRTQMWHASKEVEWISLYMIKTIPFLSHHYFTCFRCHEQIKLDWIHSRKISKPDQHAILIEYIENRQIADKTEVQKQYLKSRRDATQIRDRDVGS